MRRQRGDGAALCSWAFTDFTLICCRELRSMTWPLRCREMNWKWVSISICASSPFMMRSHHISFLPRASINKDDKDGFVSKIWICCFHKNEWMNECKVCFRNLLLLDYNKWNYWRNTHTYNLLNHFQKALDYKLNQWKPKSRNNSLFTGSILDSPGKAWQVKGQDFRRTSPDTTPDIRTLTTADN